MEVTIYQRIMLILEDKQVSVNALSKLVDMSQTTLNTQLKGERALSANVVAKVLVAYPDVSAEWLMRGIGTMYHKEGADDSPYMVAETPHREESKIEESYQDDSVWKAKYEELEKRYDQLLSILGGGMSKANVG
nr:MAG TPA: SOS-response transcriptional repressor [Caudoviricetes sp.]